MSNGFVTTRKKKIFISKQNKNERRHRSKPKNNRKKKHSHILFCYFNSISVFLLLLLPQVFIIFSIRHLPQKENLSYHVDAVLFNFLVQIKVKEIETQSRGF